MSATREIGSVQSHEVRALDFLEEIGLREFTQEELSGFYQALGSAIDIGLKREGAPTEEDGGLLCIPTGVEPLTPEEWARVPIGRRVISCAFAGTNWLTAEVTKGQDGRPAVRILRTRQILESEKQQPFAGLIGLMGEEIVRGLCEIRTEKLDTVSVALGFAQRNQQREYGIEAQFMSAAPSKFFRILDYDDAIPPAGQPYIGEALIEYLKSHGFGQIQRIFLNNDAYALVHSISPEEATGQASNLPAGCVFGTGDNAALGQYNLEAGRARIIPRDAILQEMIKRGLVPTEKNLMEYWMGGDYLRGRVAAAVGLAERLTERERLISSGEKIYEWMLGSQNGALISQLASGELTAQQQRVELGIEIEEEDYAFLKECSRRALAQAGFLMGVMLGAVGKAAEYQGGVAQLPIEGSVFWKGFGVQEQARKTLNLLLPGNKLTFVPASGLEGIAQLAMGRTT